MITKVFAFFYEKAKKTDRTQKAFCQKMRGATNQIKPLSGYYL
jgi:hypothetical protein